MTLAMEFLFELKAELVFPSLDLGETPLGRRVIVNAPAGIFAGPRLRGQVTGSNGGDWIVLRADGVAVLDVRLTLRTEDGALILMTYSGRVCATSPDVMGLVLDYSGPFHRYDPAQVYFRTNPVFETASPGYAWLNKLIAVGSGRTGEGTVIYQVFAVT